jgi:hypothetical protein
VRIALVFLIAACSSVKQTEGPSSPSVKQTDVASPTSPDASTKSAGSGDSWAVKPADPADDLAQLRADVAVMCGAAKATGGKTFSEVGPHIAENMKTHAKVELFADFRHSTLDEIVARMRALMARANVTQCDTVDVLIANDPRKRG